MSIILINTDLLGCYTPITIHVHLIYGKISEVILKSAKKLTQTFCFLIRKKFQNMRR